VHRFSSRNSSCVYQFVVETLCLWIVVIARISAGHKGTRRQFARAQARRRSGKRLVQITLTLALQKMHAKDVNTALEA
jgi:hypothetical protein